MKGKLNLLKLRKKLISKRNEVLKDSIEEGSSLFTQNVNTFKLKGDDYLEEAEKRRRKIYENKLMEKKKALDEIQKLHTFNLQRIEQEKKTKNEKILLSHSKNSPNKNLSFPDLFTSTNNTNIDNITSNNNITNENEEDFHKTSQKNYNDIMHPKNSQNLKEYALILKRIKATRKKDPPYPGPNAYDIRQNLSDGNKGFTITGKRKEISTDKLDPSFPNLKDEFDIIVQKALKNHYNKVTYSPRFKQIVKEKNREPYPNEKIWKKWELNKIDIKNNKLNYLIQNYKEKKKKQTEKIDLIRQQTEEITRLRREIQIRKGYDDPTEIKEINYSQVEITTPKITLKGRHPPKKTIKEEYNLTTVPKGINSDQDLMNYYIKNYEIFRPLPNANYVKPNLPSVVFSKEERFHTKEYQGPIDLFQNGVFDLKTQENFACKSPYDNLSKRSSLEKRKDKSPSPAEYIIKSSFEMIAEKGKKMNEIRNGIRIREMLRNIRNNENKDNERQFVKINKIKRKNEEKNKKDDKNDKNYLTEKNNNIDVLEE